MPFLKKLHSLGKICNLKLLKEEGLLKRPHKGLFKKTKKGPLFKG